MLNVTYILVSCLAVVLPYVCMYVFYILSLKGMNSLPLNCSLPYRIIMNSLTPIELRGTFSHSH